MRDNNILSGSSSPRPARSDLALFANFVRYLAETPRRRYEGHKDRCVTRGSSRPWISTFRTFQNRGDEQLRNCLFQQQCAVRNWDVLGGKSVLKGSQVTENMVARDGIEPPTPAFSGPDSTAANPLNSFDLPAISPSFHSKILER